ncbi:MAG: hypothetical protein R3A51_12120 [Nannocystaceae bacterium]
MNRLLALARRRLLQVARDRLTTAISMVMLPVLQLLLFGWAIDTDVRHIPTVIFDQDASAASRDLVRRVELTGYYDIVGEARSYDEIGEAAACAAVAPATWPGAARAAARRLARPPDAVQLRDRRLRSAHRRQR